MVKIAGVSSLVVMVKLFTVGACGAGSLLVGLEEQVQMNKILSINQNFLIEIIYKKLFYNVRARYTITLPRLFFDLG
jgi:hypothetical protein